MIVVRRASPNFNTRPVPVDCVVLHATADSDTRASVEWCCTPKPKNPNPVSYHVIVDRDGTTYHLVDTDKRAWHAGVSSFHGRANVNDFSIGLSFGNKNDGKERYTNEQYLVGAEIVAGWMKKYPAIKLDRITTHAVIAPERKTDPLAFDMQRFRMLVEACLVEMGK
jgi:N-acetyl-anhydromuramyl-L-alanine amidase AmpD